VSAAAVQTGARERDAFVSMLARLDAQLDRDLATTDGEDTDFVPTLQLLKPDEIAALTAAAPRREATAARALSVKPARTFARLLPWLVGGGLAAGAASFAMSFSGARPVAPRLSEVATIVPVAPVVSAAPAASAVVVAAAAPTPEPAPAVTPAPAAIPAGTPPATVALLQPPPAAASTDSCPPARRALGLCELPAP
jgi:angiomotin